MLKLRIEGSPDEISSFFERIKDAEGLQTQYKTTLSKRDASHVWASCKAGINVERMKGDVSLKVEVSGRSPKKKRGAPKPGIVYVMPAYGQAGVLGYKIGSSAHGLSRRSLFSVKMPFAVEFIALIYSEDCRKLEKELHTKYKAMRKGRSEFFELSPVHLSQLKGMMSSRDKELLAEMKEK